MKRISTIVLLVLSLSLLVACAPATTTNRTEGDSAADRLQVVASFHAIEQFVRAVGGDLIDLTTIVPDGAGAHGFEPKAQDMLKLAEADLFVINGLGMEPWAEAAVSSAGRSDLVLLDTSAGLDLIPLSNGEHAEEADHTAEEEHDEEEHEEDHDHGDHDPHIWLGLSTAQKQVDAIRKALADLDPANAEAYNANAAAFTESLQERLDTYKPQFAALANRTLVTGHAAFAYLCRDLGLVQNSVQNVYADGEPSARQLAELVEYSKEHGVKTIFAEHLASPDVSQTLANEVGAEVRTIYTLEATEDGKTYIERVDANLATILASLQP